MGNGQGSSNALKRESNAAGESEESNGFSRCAKIKQYPPSGKNGSAHFEAPSSLMHQAPSSYDKKT